MGVLVLFVQGQLSSQIWMPPKSALISDSTYRHYTSMLRISKVNRTSNQESTRDAAWHNKYIAYYHLRAPVDTVFEHLQQALDNSLACECDFLKANDYTFADRLKALSASQFDCAMERCARFYAQMNPRVMEQMRVMKEADNDLREAMERTGKTAFTSPDAALWNMQHERDARNQRALAQIMDSIGYPGISTVGTVLSIVAAMVIIHAPLTYQTKYYPMVEQAVASRELEKKYLAYLKDRMLMSTGKKQLYGTQLVFNKKSNALEVYPVEKLATIDVLRAAMGMEPLSEYMKENGVTVIQQ